MAETARVREAVTLARQHHPDLIVLDPEVRGRLNLQIIADVARAAPDSRVCIRTTVFEPSSCFEALLIGARLYALKTGADSEFLREALILVGRTDADIIGPAIGRQFRSLPPGTFAIRALEPSTPVLPAREQLVLRRLAGGMHRRQIAEVEHLSRATVDRTIASLFQKLGVSSTAELIAEAGRRGMLP